MRLQEIGISASSLLILSGLFLGVTPQTTTTKGAIEGNNGMYELSGEIREAGNGQYHFQDESSSITVIGECPPFTSCKGYGTLTVSKQADNFTLSNFKRESRKVKVISSNDTSYYLEDGRSIPKTKENQRNLKMEGFFNGELYYYD